MVRFGARDYDPETGTWLTPEPLGFAAGDNFYAYAAGNPVAYNDPTGLAPSRAELTFLAELFGVGSTASMINERDASIEAVSHGDIGKAECHAAAAASASVGAVVEIGMLAATRGTSVYRAVNGKGETSPRSSASKSRVAGIKMKSPGVCWVAETQHRTPGSFSSERSTILAAE